MYYVGLDIGTSSVKALLFRKRGSRGFRNPEYPFQTPKPLWAETDPEVWWEATCKAMLRCLAKSKAARLRRSALPGKCTEWLPWTQRAAFCGPASCGTTKDRIGNVRNYSNGRRSEILRITGNPVLAGFTAPRFFGSKTTNRTSFPPLTRSSCQRTTFVTSSVENSLPAFRMHPVLPFWTLAIENGPRKCSMHWDGPLNGCPR